MAALISASLHITEICKSVELLEYCFFYVKKLLKDGYDLRIVRSESSKPEKRSIARSSLKSIWKLAVQCKKLVNFMKFIAFDDLGLLSRIVWEKQLLTVNGRQKLGQTVQKNSCWQKSHFLGMKNSWPLMLKRTSITAGTQTDLSTSGEDKNVQIILYSKGASKGNCPQHCGKW